MCTKECEANQMADLTLYLNIERKHNILDCFVTCGSNLDDVSSRWSEVQKVFSVFHLFYVTVTDYNIIVNAYIV